MIFIQEQRVNLVIEIRILFKKQKSSLIKGLRFTKNWSLKKKFKVWKKVLEETVKLKNQKENLSEKPKQKEFKNFLEQIKEEQKTTI